MTDKTEHENLAAALAAFQAEAPTVHKGKTANTGSYSYKYADLADVANAAYPILSKHGLSFSASPRHLPDVGFVLFGVLRHTSGDSDEGCLPIIGRDAQAIGSSLTYLRRYLLGCMTGIVTDEDDDGQRATRARGERPESDQGRRQQGRAPQEDTAGPDLSVVRAHVLAAAKAKDEKQLRGVWDQAKASGTLGEQVADPDVDAPDAECPRITVGDFITRRKQQIEAA